MKYDRQMIADHNRACVIELISKKGPINRAEIAKQLDLSIPTIMKIADDFMKAGIIRMNGKGESTGGKRPELYEIVADAYYCIGIDVGRSKINTVVVDLKGRIVKKSLVNVKDLNTPDEFLDVIINQIDEIINDSNFAVRKFMGIGLGVPGIIEKRTNSILYSPDFGWENVNLVDPIRDKYKMWVLIENSNRTMALGEKWSGAGENAAHIFGINIGYGIGAAILEDDKVYHGSSGTSGEFGHIVLKRDGPLCDCGNKGCLEALSSGNAIAKVMGTQEAKEVFDLARNGDKKALVIINEAIEYFGIGIAGAINILDPDMVILSGGIMKSYDLFYDELLDVIKKHQMKYAGRHVKIKIGALGEDATAIGAAVLLLRNFKNHGGQVV